jgi:hypothetical protein
VENPHHADRPVQKYCGKCSNALIGRPSCSQYSIKLDPQHSSCRKTRHRHAEKQRGGGKAEIYVVVE